MKDELECMWNKEVMDYFEVLSKYME